MRLSRSPNHCYVTFSVIRTIVLGLFRPFGPLLWDVFGRRKSSTTLVDQCCETFSVMGDQSYGTFSVNLDDRKKFHNIGPPVSGTFPVIRTNFMGLFRSSGPMSWDFFGHFVDRNTLVPMLWDLFGHFGPRVWVLGFRALGPRVWVLGFKAYRVWALWFRARALGFKASGLGFN